MIYIDRTLLCDNPYADVLRQAIAAIASHNQGGESLFPASSTLPAETVQQLVGNTVAVMTSHIDKRDEWREQLAQLRADFASRGEEYAIEVAFADALLAVLDGDSPSLPEDNPYADVLRQVIDAIVSHNQGGGS